MGKLFSREKIKHADSYVAFATGVLILAIMVVVAFQSNSLYAKLNMGHHDRMAVSLATTIGEAIEKVAFSGQYQTRLLVEGLSKANEQVATISVENRDRRIVANSDAGRNGAMLADGEWEENQRCMTMDKPMVSRMAIGGERVKTVLVPYRGGFDNEIQGVVRLTYDEKAGSEGQKRILFQILRMIIIVTALMMISVYLFSRYFGKRVRYLASHLEGILNNAPVGIVVFDKAGAIKIQSRKLSDYFRRSDSAACVAELPDESLDEKSRHQIRETMIGSVSREPYEKEIEVAQDGKERAWQVSYFPITLDRADGSLACMLFSDMTERRTAQRLLQQSEQKARAILDQSFQFVGLLTAEGILREANRTALEFAGVSSADVFGKPFWETPWWKNSPEEREKLKRSIGKAAGGEHVRYETIHCSRQGEQRCVDFSLKPLKDENDRVMYLIAEGHDITGIKRAEEALQASERRFSQLIQNSFDTVVILDADGIQRYVSASAERMHGYAPSELVDIPVIEQMIHPDDKEQVQKAFRQILEAGEGGVQYRHRCKAGGWVWLEARGTNQLDNPDIRGVVVNVRDVAERRRAEEELRESEAKLSALFASMAEMVVLHELEFDEGGKPVNYRITDCNEAFTRITGIRREDAVGRLGHEVYAASAPPYLGEFSRVALGGEPCHFETYYAPMDKYFRISVASPGKNRFATITADITDRKRAEKEWETLQTQLAQAQKMETVGRLAGGVAHDFNNMLGVIQGHAEMALEDLGPEDRHRGDLEEIANAARRSADLTRQLLAFARKQTIEPKVLDLNAAIAGMLKMIGRLIGEDIALAWKPGKDLWAVKLDPAQMDQILVNLCVNARDAIGGVGHLTIETGNATFDEAYCARHAEAIPGDYVLLAVSDDGCGMGPEVVAHLFEPFFTTKAVGEGTGLGLATVYGAVKQNGGFIYADSEPGKGTTFKIYFPRQRVQAVHAAPHKVPAAAKGSGTILLVEDEPAILRMTVAILERLGYAVVAAANPAEALQLAREHAGRLDLLLSDVVMPGMNGRDLAMKLIEIRPGIRRLFMSGYTADAIANHGLLEEGVQFIQKPFTPHDLAEKLREVLGE